MYINTADEDSMVVQFVLACRRGKRELLPDPPPKPVEEIKKEEPEPTEDKTEVDTEADTVADADAPKVEGEEKPAETGEAEVKTETGELEETKTDEAKPVSLEENDTPMADEEKKGEEPQTEKEPTETIEPAELPETNGPEEKSEQPDTEVTEPEKPADEQQPMETGESEKTEDTEAKAESESEKEEEKEKVEEGETKMECDDEKTLTEPTEEKEAIDEAEKSETAEESASEKTEEQPMETETEAETEAETESSEPKQEVKADPSQEESASDEKSNEETEVKTESEDKEEKPEPVFIEVDEYYVKYRNFSYLHCEWRTEEELLKGDRRVSAKIRRFQMKQSQQMNIFENLEDEPFNPDFVETDRVLDMSVHEDPVTGKKTRNFLVKWKSLPYEDCTWELEDDVEEKKIEEYNRFKKVPPKDKWKPKRRPTPDQWRKLNETPIYKNNNTLRAYQLEGLNWLKFSWYNSHNCILADEMGLGKTVSLNVS